MNDVHFHGHQAEERPPDTPPRQKPTIQEPAASSTPSGAQLPGVPAAATRPQSPQAPRPGSAGPALSLLDL